MRTAGGASVVWCGVVWCGWAQKERAIFDVWFQRNSGARGQERKGKKGEGSGVSTQRQDSSGRRQWADQAEHNQIRILLEFVIGRALQILSFSKWSKLFVVYY